MQQCVKELDTLRHLVKALRMGKVLYWRVNITSAQTDNTPGVQAVRQRELRRLL